MATTAKEAYSKVCLLVMVNSCGSPTDMCMPGDCSAWEWDDGREEGVERTGHCALAGRSAALPARRRKELRICIPSVAIPRIG
jgi:hypothetical protein